MRVLTPLLPLSLMALPAVADVTADDVWADWQALTAKYGVTLSAEGQVRAGDSLRFEGVRKSWTASDGSTATAKIAALTLTETDGTVIGVLDAPVTFEIRHRSVEMGSSLTNGTMDFGKGTILADGTPGAIHYTYTYPAVAFEFTTVGMGPSGPSTDAGSGTLNDVLGHSQSATQPGAPFDLDLSIAQATFQSTASAGGTQAKAEGTAENFAMTFALPAQTVATVPPQFDVTWTVGASAQDMAVSAPDGAFTTRIATEGTQAEARHRDGLVTWTATQGTTAMDISVQTFAFPISLTLDHGATAGSFRTDVSPAPYQGTVTLDGITVNPELWGIFDPEGHINRAPARLDLDLAGLAALPSENIPSPAKSTLSIRKAELTAGGATLAAKGDLKLDAFSTPGTIVPEGNLHLTLDGGLALLDSLVQAQVIPAQQLMGVQLMIGMLAVQDGTADRLMSDFQFGPGQQVFINGTQMR